MGFAAPRDGIHLMALHGDVEEGALRSHRPGGHRRQRLAYLALGHIHACSGLQRRGHVLGLPRLSRGRGLTSWATRACWW